MIFMSLLHQITDTEKAFDCAEHDAEHEAILKALRTICTNEAYVNILQRYTSITKSQQKDQYLQD